MAPQRSSSTKEQRPKSSGGLRQGTLSFASAKRSGSTGAKDSLKGKAAAESPAIGPIRIRGKRKYEPDPESECEPAKEEATEVLERESLNPEDPRWNKAYGLARAKMGNIQPGSSGFPYRLDLAEKVPISGAVHAQGQLPVHHILRVFDLYVMCYTSRRDWTYSNTAT
jgi:DNA polymerase delta subunit 4